MDKHGIIEILSFLGCRQIKMRGRDWVQSTCPFERTHKNGVDRHPSFGVRIRSGEKSGWGCFSCGESGTLKNLLYRCWQGGIIPQTPPHIRKLLDEETNDLSVLCSNLQKVEYWVSPVTVSGVQLSGRDPMHLEWAKSEVFKDESLVDAYTCHGIRSLLYLQGPKRKLSLETIWDWGLGYDPRTDRIIIPIRDYKSRLLGFTGRALTKDKRPKYRNDKGLPKDLVLYGEHKRDPEIRHGYISEGFFDVIYLNQLGFKNVFGIMGVSLSEVQRIKLSTWLDEVTIIEHGDDAGKKATDKLNKSLNKYLKINKVSCLPGKDPNSSSEYWLYKNLRKKCQIGIQQEEKD